MPPSSFWGMTSPRSRFSAIRWSLKSTSLESIYEHPFIFASYIQNHQAKLFALTAEDKPQSYHQALDINEKRLDAARQSLEQVDVVGTHERYEQLLAELRRRFGWELPRIPNRNVTSSKEAVPASFRSRIAEDNAVDMEFFRYATCLCERRLAQTRSDED